MPAGLAAILTLEVPVIVQIAERTMPVEEVLSIVPGAIIELPKSADDDLEILVNNKAIGTGAAVKIGENYGIRVTYIGDLSQRIIALGEDRAAAEPDDLPDFQTAASSSRLSSRIRTTCIINGLSTSCSK